MDYARAIELDPQDAAVYYNRGTTLNNLGRHEEAIVDFTRAINLDPQHAGAYNNRGFALGHLGRYEESISDLTCAIELNTQSGRIKSRRAYGNLKRDQEAVAKIGKPIRSRRANGR